MLVDLQGVFSDAGAREGRFHLTRVDLRADGSLSAWVRLGVDRVDPSTGGGIDVSGADPVTENIPELAHANGSRSPD
jgi:hypothetical protein